MTEMTEIQMLKAQLVAVLDMSNTVEAQRDPVGRLDALEALQAAIQAARPVLITYAADLMVELSDTP